MVQFVQLLLSVLSFGWDDVVVVWDGSSLDRQALDTIVSVQPDDSRNGPMAS